jgi:hypothetical protein
MVQKHHDATARFPVSLPSTQRRRLDLGTAGAGGSNSSLVVALLVRDPQGEPRHREVRRAMAASLPGNPPTA